MCLYALRMKLNYAVLTIVVVVSVGVVIAVVADVDV